jgi:pimeloyl-ACP methyl ester carboxylesterase
VDAPDLDEVTEALDRLIEREGLVKPVLVGHSSATVVAVRYAADRPGRIAGVVSVDPVAESRVAELTVPFLAMHGLTGDVPAAAMRLELAARYGAVPMPPGGRIVVIEDGGSEMWEDRPDAFDRALAGFVLGSSTEVIPRR